LKKSIVTQLKLRNSHFEALVAHIQFNTVYHVVFFYLETLTNQREYFILQDHGLEDMVKSENFVVLTNLQWRAASPTCRIPTAFVQENTLFTLNPKDAEMSRYLAELREDLVVSICIKNSCTTRLGCCVLIFIMMIKLVNFVCIDTGR